MAFILVFITSSSPPPGELSITVTSAIKYSNPPWIYWSSRDPRRYKNHETVNLLKRHSTCVFLVCRTPQPISTKGKCAKLIVNCVVNNNRGHTSRQSSAENKYVYKYTCNGGEGGNGKARAERPSPFFMSSWTSVEVEIEWKVFAMQRNRVKSIRL